MGLTVDNPSCAGKRRAYHAAFGQADLRAATLKPNQNREIRRLGKLLLEIGALLMSSGANTARIRVTINRISEAFGYAAELFVTHRALTLTLNDKAHEDVFSSTKRTSPHGVNFKVVSGISRMSWRVVEENWSIAAIRGELKRLSALPHYPRLLVVSMVALSGASFCRLAGGKPVEMAIVFIASLLGLLVRQEAHKREFNPYLCVYLSASTAALVCGALMKFGLATKFENAFATSVLFLIPGIPLINTFSDFVDGNFLNGLSRFSHGLFISFCIALGLLSAIYIYGF